MIQINKVRYCRNPRSEEYQEYLQKHIGGVKRSWNEILKPALLKAGEITEDVCQYFDQVIENHDASKYELDEYLPYCNYFYPSGKYEKDETAFNQAWLMHIHRNPHHWQHWILVHDEGNSEPMDMPLEFVFESICDWHSFTLRDPKSTAYAWYEKTGKTMQLSKKSRELFDKYIVYMQEPLIAEESGE